MYYRRDEFFRLLDEVEFQGGALLDKTHDNVYHTEFTGEDKRVQGHEVEYCGENALFTVPYFGEGDNDTQLAIEVCAVDDCMGLWPRFANAEAPGQWS